MRLNIAPDADPSPSTKEGAHSLVERFHALKRTEVGVGGCLPSGSLTSPSSLPTTKPKSTLNKMLEASYARHKREARSVVSSVRDGYGAEVHAFRRRKEDLP